MSIQKFIEDNGLVKMDEDTWNKVSIYGDPLCDHADFDIDDGEFYYKDDEITDNGDLRMLWLLVEKQGTSKDQLNEIAFLCDKCDSGYVEVDDDKSFLFRFYWEVL